MFINVDKNILGSAQTKTDILYIYHMLRFDIKSPKDTIGVVKATVHKNGKLGFSSGAMKVLGLDVNRYWRVATNADDIEDDSLYLLPAQEGEESVFKASRAGQYYYMRIKHLLDEMEIDYGNQKVIYDILKKEQEGMIFYKLNRREPRSRSSE